MKKKSKEWKEGASDLLYFLELYNELRGREGAQETLEWLNERIDALVEKLKTM